MNVEYKYRPPFKYLFVGLGGLFASAIFALAIGKDELWFSFVAGFFCLMMFAMGIGRITSYNVCYTKLLRNRNLKESIRQT